MKKYIFTLLYFIVSVSFFLAQKVTKEFFHPNIYETTNGFLVYGFSDEGKETFLNLIQYDKNLNEKNSISQPVKNDKYSTSKIYSYGYEFWLYYSMFGKKGAFLKIDTGLKVLSFKEYESEDMDILIAEFKRQDPNNHFPAIVYPGQDQPKNFIDVGEYYLEYNYEKRVIKGYKRKQTELFQSYAILWEIKLDLGESKGLITPFFYTGSNGRAYFYCSIGDNNKDEYLFCVDYVAGKMLYRLKLELEDANHRPSWSNMYEEAKDNSVLIAGDYYKPNEKNRKPPETMDGYFVMRVDATGKVLARKSVKFEHPIPSELKEDAFEKKSMCFQKIEKNAKGNYQLLGENMRLVNSVGTVSTQAGNSVVQGVDYQTYGFTFLEIDPDLNFVESKYEPIKWVNNNHKIVQLNKRTPQNGSFSGYPENIFGLILKRNRNLNFRYGYCVSNKGNTQLIYMVAINYYMAMSRSNSEVTYAYFKDLDVKEDNDGYPYWNLFFEGDETSYYLFAPTKKSFVLEKRSY